MRQPFFIFIFLNFGAFAQDSSLFHSIDDLNTKPADVKIIMIHADWCSICKSSEKMMNNSQKIAEASRDKIAFFTLSQQHLGNIIFHGREFNYRRTGLHEGQHELITYLCNNETPIYPTYFVLDKESNVLGSIEGAISESSWLDFLGSITNASNKPDSVRNN